MTKDYPAVSWWSASAPVSEVAVGSPLWVGVRLAFTAAGRIFGFRQYLKAPDSGDHWLIFWDEDAQHLIFAREFKNVVWGASNGWQQVWPHPAFRPTIGTHYRLAILYTGLSYFRTASVLASPVTHNSIQFIKGFTATALDPLLATPTLNNFANGVDVLYHLD